jgi:hypothetical protein
MNSLRSALTAASPAANPLISGQKENIKYELTQPQNDLTPTGLLMEGQCTIPEPIRREAQLCRSCH